MKRSTGITAITVALLFFMAAAGVDASYTVLGFVNNADGSIGNIATENSSCGLKTYRKGIPGEIGKQLIGPDGLCTEKIFYAGYTSGFAAYYNSDVGSSLWSTAVVLGQEVVAIAESYNGQFTGCTIPWTGGSYVGARKKILADLIEDVNSGECNLPVTRLQPVPVPQVSSIGVSDVTLTWTGIAYDPDDLVLGYTVFRSTEPGGAGGFGEIGTAAQVKGGTVTYNDSGLSDSYTYYYRLAVNFEWGGGNGAPAYYVTDARSDVSGGVYTANSPTPEMTETETPVFSVTFTVTYTSTSSMSDTPTFTITPTVTTTVTLTITAIDTPTGTDTGTVTATITQTITQTATSFVTESATITCTSSLPPTDTRTATPADTITQTFTNTRTATVTESGTFTATGTYTLTNTATLTASLTVILTGTKTYTRTNTPTRTVTSTCTRTVTRTTTRTVTPTKTAAAQPTMNISLTYKTGDTNATTTSPHPFYIIYNNSQASLSLNRVEIRYWYIYEGSGQAEYGVVDYAGRMPSGINITGNINIQIEPGSFGGNQNRCMKVIFNAGAGSLAHGEYAYVNARFNKSDWSRYYQNNDYSFAPYSNYTVWSKVAVYVDGNKVWGYEPGQIGSSSASKEQPTPAMIEDMNSSNVYVYPNPSSGKTAIRFPLFVPSETRLIIYDVGGKIVWIKHVKAAETIRGINTFSWNGQNDCGQDVSGGVYMLEVVSGDKSIRKKIAIIR